MPKTKEAKAKAPDVVFVPESELVVEGRASAYATEDALAFNEDIGTEWVRVAVYRLDRVVRVRRLVEQG